MSTPRYDWYQSSSSVNISFFVKNINDESLELELTPSSFSVSFVGGDGEKYAFSTDLPHTVVPEECHHRIFGTKLEVELAKEEEYTWKSLSKTDNEEATIHRKQATGTSVTSPFRKNWKELEKELESDEEGGNGDGASGVNDFFKKLYADADDETRRAMMKSFIESNGTALSTDWNTVSKGKVETTPPDGMVAKEWK